MPDTRLDLASCEADVPQHVVIESLKLRDGAFHDPFFKGIAEDTREALARSSPRAHAGGC